VEVVPRPNPHFMFASLKAVAGVIPHQCRQLKDITSRNSNLN
jgi:hypothetical protein